MDIVAAAPVASWIVLGVLLGIAAMLLVAAATAVVVRRRATRRAPEPAAASRGWADDDLPAFLETPPGSAARAADGDLVALAAPPPPPPRRAARFPVLAAATGAGVLLIAAALVAAAAGAEPGGRGADRPGPADRSVSADPDRPGRIEGTEARLAAAGVVLEERAVGVTATYPEVVLVAGRDGPVARVTLPTWNCLSTAAPTDPVAAGCARGRTEYAELRPPSLGFERRDDGVELSGDFPTSHRPAGSGPVATGRSYELVISVAAVGDLRPGRWTPVRGAVTLASRPAVPVEGELRVGG